MIKRWLIDVLIGAGLFAGLLLLLSFAAGKQALFMYAVF